MEKKFTFIISAITNNNYSINFRCWVIDAEGNQENLAILVDNGISLDDALISQNNFITENK